MSQVNANVNQMCESLGYGRAAVAVSLFSVGNGLGRILAGTLSELVHRSQCAPRTFSLLASATLMTAAHFLFWLELGEGALYTAVFLSALAFGATWPLTVVVTSELWGTVHHGANYLLFDGCTAALATPLVGKYLAQAVYTAHISGHCPADGNATGAACAGAGCAACGGTSDCHGVECFRLAHAVTGKMTTLFRFVGLPISLTAKRHYCRGVLCVRRAVSACADAQESRPVFPDLAVGGRSCAGRQNELGLGLQLTDRDTSLIYYMT